MKALARCVGTAAVAALVLGLLGPARAEAAKITGQIDGIEVAVQGGSHGAIFVFDFVGQIDNGRTRKGFGWIEVFYVEPLPTNTGDSTAIVRGRGVVWIGLQRFDIVVEPQVDGITLTGLKLFHVAAPLEISPRRGGPVAHTFDGTLDHGTFPPTIYGTVGP